MSTAIICLANSYKHGGRCVAGICLKTGKWMRLRSKSGDGSLSVQRCTLADGKGELRLLDVFEVDLHYALPSDCHPEDWVTVDVPWRLVERPCSATSWKTVISRTERRGLLLGGYGDRVWAAIFRKRPATASLALICPTEIWWWVKDDHGRTKYRALFRRDNITFDLAVTDPRWLEQLQLLPVGVHPHRLLAPGAGETWLVVSLSEAFAFGNGGAAHFKIVAGVIVRD